MGSSFLLLPCPDRRTSELLTLHTDKKTSPTGGLENRILLEIKLKMSTIFRRGFLPFQTGSQEQQECWGDVGEHYGWLRSIFISAGLVCTLLTGCCLTGGLTLTVQHGTCELGSRLPRPIGTLTTRLRRAGPPADCWGTATTRTRLDYLNDNIKFVLGNLNS